MADILEGKIEKDPKQLFGAVATSDLENFEKSSSEPMYTGDDFWGKSAGKHKPLQFNVTEIVTLWEGRCLKIQPLEKVSQIIM